MPNVYCDECVKFMGTVKLDVLFQCLGDADPGDACERCGGHTTPRAQGIDLKPIVGQRKREK